MSVCRLEVLADHLSTLDAYRDEVDALGKDFILETHLGRMFGTIAVQAFVAKRLVYSGIRIHTDK